MSFLSRRSALVLLVVLALGTLLLAAAQPAQAQTPQVRAVLFYSPTCPHCHYVFTQVLPPLQQTYGSQLSIVFINIDTQQGAQTWGSALETFNIPNDRYGVPFLLVGDQNMVGQLEIEQMFPGLIQTYLSAGGVSWPIFPGLQPYLDDPTAYLAPLATAVPPPTQPSITQRLQGDVAGNTLSILVLLGLFASGLWNLRRIRTEPNPGQPWPTWVEQFLLFAGLVVAGYLTWIEITSSAAMCGPVGDCNAVQQSEYARLFGFLPVGLLGLGGYVVFSILWLLDPTLKGTPRLNLNRVTWWLAAFGVVFSLYLTFLEPFVIGATCIWCLSSAIFNGVDFLADHHQTSLGAGERSP